MPCPTLCHAARAALWPDLPVCLPPRTTTLRIKLHGCCSADDYWAKQREAERTARYEQRRKEWEKEQLRELRKRPLSAVKPAASKVYTPGASTVCAAGCLQHGQA